MASKPQPSEIKALFLTREYPPEVYGGAGVHVDYLTRELARLIPVEVRTFGDQDLSEKNLDVHGFRFAQGGSEDVPEKFLLALQALRVGIGFAARVIPADVVHCHTWYAHFGGLLAKLLYGIPLVITAHSLEPLRPWKREQLGRAADLSAWVERTALEAADAVIAVSQEMKADILRHFRVSAERVAVIHNGIDPEEYNRVEARDRLARFGIDLARPTVLFLGRISRQKGILHLLAAVPHLDPHAQVVLCATSPDSEEIAREVQAALDRVQGVRDRVIWIREMVDRPTAIAALFAGIGVLLPLDLRAVRHHQPGGHGLPDPGGRQRGRRDPGGRGGRRDRVPGPCGDASRAFVRARAARRIRSRSLAIHQRPPRGSRAPPAHGRQRASPGRGPIQLARGGRGNARPLQDPAAG